MRAGLAMVYAPVVGPHVLSCCRSPWPPHRLSPLGPLFRTCIRCHSIPVGSSSASSQNKMLLAAFDTDLETNFIAEREFNPFFLPARRRPVSLLRRRIQPPDGALRRCRSFTCGGACLCPRASRLSVAALPLLPKKSRNS